jgi:hypothetical protein
MSREPTAICLAEKDGKRIPLSKTSKTMKEEVQ